MSAETSTLPEDWTIEETDCGTTCLMDEDGFLVTSTPDYDEIFRRLSAALHWHSQNAGPVEQKIKLLKIADS